MSIKKPELELRVYGVYKVYLVNFFFSEIVYLVSCLESCSSLKYNAKLMKQISCN